TVGHSYVSSSLAKGTLGDGWNFLHDHLLTVFDPEGIDHTNALRLPLNSWNIYAILDEPFSGRIQFKGKCVLNEKEHFHLNDFELKTKNSGFTNLSGGTISGQTNIKNIRTHWDRHDDIWYVTLGDGTKRRYERQKKRPRAACFRDYHLVKETKPNGNF